MSDHVNSTGASNASGLPLACPQSDLDASEYTEDCLSMILYVPSSVTVGSNAPVLMWYESRLCRSMAGV